jgi:putative spermidine/putrescine transport system permease protein
MSARRFTFIMSLPLGVLIGAFFVLPMAQLFLGSFTTREGMPTYLTILTTPRYLSSIAATLILSVLTTVLTLALGTIVALLLARHRFPGRSVLTSLLTFPLAFPGVVVGFMVILLAGRQGMIGEISRLLTGEKIVFAYSMTGLLVGYLYFSIPRVLLTVMASVEKLDPSLEEAARSLGASPLRVLFDVVLPALMPAFIASGAICFATAMGAFGTAFTLAAKIDVLPMVIYTEFTLNANVAMSAALSIVLGVITWLALTLARTFGGTGVAAAG